MWQGRRPPPSRATGGHPCEILLDPVPSGVETVPLPIGLSPLLSPRSPDRRRRIAAVAPDLRGDPLAHGALRPRIEQQKIVRVRVHIHKTGTGDEALRPNDASALRFGDLSHGGDPIPVNRNVPSQRRGSPAPPTAPTRA